MIFGNVSIQPRAFKDVTKDEFIQMYKGKMNYDINKAWDELQVVLKSESVINEVVAEVKEIIKKKKNNLGKSKSIFSPL